MIGDKSGKSVAFLSGRVKVGFYFSDSFQIFAVGCDHSQQIKSQICIVGGRGGGARQENTKSSNTKDSGREW